MVAARRNRRQRTGASPSANAAKVRTHGLLPTLLTRVGLAVIFPMLLPLWLFKRLWGLRARSMKRRKVRKFMTATVCCFTNLSTTVMGFGCR